MFVAFPNPDRFYVTGDGYLITNSHVVADCKRISTRDFGTANNIAFSFRKVVAKLESQISVPLDCTE
jgi:S1-C subfamily serine protease